MFERNALKTALVLGGLVVAAGLALPAPPAQARVVVGVGIGVPVVGPAPWYPYPPAYYAPPPVYYPPAPVYVQPAPVYVAPPPPVYYPPAQPATVAPQAQSWYYCDNPKGYYPYVQNCNAGWRPVPANPGGGPPH
jgi:hypothetical protein